MQEVGTETVIAHNDPSPARDRVLRLYERRHQPINIRVALPSLDGIKRAVEMGLGVAVLPRRVALAEIARDGSWRSKSPSSARSGTCAWCSGAPRAVACGGRVSRPSAQLAPRELAENPPLETPRKPQLVRRQRSSPRPPRSDRAAARSHPSCRRGTIRAPRRQRHRHPPVSALQLLRLEVDRDLDLRRLFDQRLQARDVRGGTGDARHAERHRVAEEDLGERLAHHRAKPPAPDRLRRVLARRAAAEVPVDDEDRRAAHSADRRAGASRSAACLCDVVLEEVCLEALEGTARRKRAGMMRSVSMSLPRKRQPRPLICVMRSIAMRAKSLERRRPRPRRRRRPPSPGSSAACGRSDCPAVP